MFISILVTIIQALFCWEVKWIAVYVIIRTNQSTYTSEQRSQRSVNYRGLGTLFKASKSYYNYRFISSFINNTQCSLLGSGLLIEEC